ncbi:RHS repeat domain-containing protein [Nitrospina gracilis]|uniref:RHS repeat domain-containing protein n=1 Tax=Nitrospina gracilis TaxID=35801 RepID=UPI003FA5800D
MGSVSRTYDNSFRITSRSVNGGNTISFTYDQDDLLTSAGSETLTNDPNNGLLTGTSLGVVTDSYAYNGFAEMADYEAQVSGTPVFGTVFERDKLGRITKKTETVNGVTHVFDYTYDTAGRLHEVFKDSVLQNTYTYDANGNRLNNGAVYDDQDRLVSTSTATYTYTANGELASKTEGGQTTTYNYDVVGNLISVTLPDSTLIEYVIDGRSRRVGKKVNGVLTKAWLYKDGLNPIAELDGAGNVVSRFVYASKSNIPDYVIKAGITYRIVSDHLGSPRQVIDTSDGTTVQQRDYDEWGNVLFDTNPGFIPFGFAGGVYDQDTKLVRFGARDYDPQTSRWTSKDPIRFGGGDVNFFGYVMADPVNMVDPNGQVPPAAVAGFVATGKLIGGVAFGVFAGATGGAISGGKTGAVIGGFVGGIVGLYNPLGSKEAGLFAAALTRTAVAAAENVVAQALGNIVRIIRGNCTLVFDPIEAVFAGFGNLLGRGLAKPSDFGKYGIEFLDSIFAGGGARAGQMVGGQLSGNDNGQISFKNPFQ